MTVRPRKAAHNEDDSRHGAPPENTFSSLGFEARHKHYLSRLRHERQPILLLPEKTALVFS